MKKLVGNTDGRFGQNCEESYQIEAKLNFLANKMLEHDVRLERIEQNMMTKLDHQEVMNVLDKIVKMYEKSDQEVTFMGSRLRRVEDQTEKNTLDIQKIKPTLGSS